MAKQQFPLPEYPTDAAPGSPEKIQVLAERARHEQCLFHPRDVQRRPQSLVRWLSSPSRLEAILTRAL